jgi:hypothetical protein
MKRISSKNIKNLSQITYYVLASSILSIIRRMGINTLHGHSPDNISVSGFNSTITFGI